ncbi:MAG: hypothetical protein IPO09_14860 [Anaeromyxobacter sp.]|nr:hypothetical protein [Anaeromyxobacter sp.]MBL0277123.1 hypothetical protein [Anaeromyxobacter sp.]
MPTTLRLLCALLPLAAGAARAAEPVAPPAATAPAPTAAPADGPILPLAPLLNGAAAWRAARWGMTPDQVLKAFVGEAVRLDPEEKLADGKVIAVGIERHDLGGLAFRVRFLFEGGTLALVSLRTPASTFAEPAAFEALEKRLAAEAGPGEVTPKESSFDMRQTRFRSGQTAVDLKYLQGTVVLLYHPTGR